MSFHVDRRHVLSGLIAAPILAAPLVGQAQAVAPVMGDVVLGDPDAPLTVIEYASFTCSHCKSFHVNTWPQFKKEYVDTGKVKFIMREVYFDKEGLWASMTARCGGEKGFYPMVDTFMKQQSVWTRGDDVGAEIQKIGRRAGLSNEQLSACLGDRDYAKTLLESYQKNAGEDGIRSTPSFIIGGELHSGRMTFEDFAKIVDAAL